MNGIARSAELKLARAESQIWALCTAVSNWIERNPISADCNLREGRLGFQLIQKEFPEPPQLEQWGLALGECVHNLRSALDNLAYALARLECDPPQKPNQVAFPIYQDRAKFESKGSLNIRQLPSEAAQLIEQMQPFQRVSPPDPCTSDRDPLVLLQWLSNADKHRVPSVVLIAPTQWTHNVAAQFKSDEDATANVPPDVSIWAGPLSPGVVLMEWRTNCPIDSVSGKYEGKAIVSIQGISEPAPLEATLLNLHQYTALVVSQFQRFFL